MKYVLLFIFYMLMTAFLIVERLVKAIATIIIFLWDFKIVKSRYVFWKYIEVPNLLTQDGSSWYFIGIKNYYKLKVGAREI